MSSLKTPYIVLKGKRVAVVIESDCTNSCTVTLQTSGVSLKMIQPKFKVKNLNHICESSDPTFQILYILVLLFCHRHHPTHGFRLHRTPSRENDRISYSHIPNCNARLVGNEKDWEKKKIKNLPNLAP